MWGLAVRVLPQEFGWIFDSLWNVTGMYNSFHLSGVLVLAAFSKRV